MQKLKERGVKVSHVFIIALSIVSIIGFLGIVIESFFFIEVGNYEEALLMLIIGAALIYEAKIKKLKSITEGLDSNNFTHLVTGIIGFIAIIAGIFSFPFLRIETSTFLAMKGILSIIAIVVIIIQTWVVD